MTEKLTVKKILTIVACASLGSVAICLLYFAIIFLSLPFTANMTTSWILSLSITSAMILLFGGYTLKTRKKRRRQNREQILCDIDEKNRDKKDHH